jgi:hypothetical protein
MGLLIGLILRGVIDIGHSDAESDLLHSDELPRVGGHAPD